MTLSDLKINELVIKKKLKLTELIMIFFSEEIKKIILIRSISIRIKITSLSS